MTDLAMNTRATIIPCLSYRDANSAVKWLCENFGFEKKAAYEDERGQIAHAELSFGNGMIMLGTVNPTSDYGSHLRQPEETGGKVTQTVYVITHDPDRIYKQAKAAGARILREIRDEDYGGRGFTCSDPEGHLWSFGSYDPWKAA
jgi:uncharacterized glyoxalase superfamily protein PhnB